MKNRILKWRLVQMVHVDNFPCAARQFSRQHLGSVYTHLSISGVTVSTAAVGHFWVLTWPPAQCTWHIWQPHVKTSEASSLVILESKWLDLISPSSTQEIPHCAHNDQGCCDRAVLHLTENVNIVLFQLRKVKFFSISRSQWSWLEQTKNYNYVGYEAFTAVIWRVLSSGL
jgi:hypothetical protein